MQQQDQAAMFNSLLQQIAGLRGETRRNSAYLARREIAQIRESASIDPKRLEPFGQKVYSQADEDGILEEIFRRINIGAGVFCEIGVQSGIECNSLYLIHKGWRGAWLEADVRQEALIEKRFQSLLRKKTLSFMLGYVTPGNINESISQALENIDINVDQLDFLSIDVDGMDVYLLEALSFRPKVICIEYNSKFPPPLKKRPVFDPDYRWKSTDYMGSSLSEMVEAASLIGYTLVGTNVTGANAFFVRDDLVGECFVETPTAEGLYNPPRYYLIYDYFYYDVGHRADFGRYCDLE